MNCPNCNEENLEGVSKCKKCGYIFNEEYENSRIVKKDNEEILTNEKELEKKDNQINETSTCTILLSVYILLYILTIVSMVYSKNGLAVGTYISAKILSVYSKMKYPKNKISTVLLVISILDVVFIIILFTALSFFITFICGICTGMPE